MQFKLNNQLKPAKFCRLHFVWKMSCFIHGNMISDSTYNFCCATCFITYITCMSPTNEYALNAPKTTTVDLTGAHTKFNVFREQKQFSKSL